MISILVCSVRKNTYDAFQQNVAATIDAPFEIIRIDNSKGKYSVCAAYNKGKAECKYDIICFSHEDVLFQSSGWGNTLVSLFRDKSIGLAGIFGACYVSAFAEDAVDRNECEGQVIKGYKEDKPLVSVSRFDNSAIAEVVGVDGVFMATTKSILSTIRFSEDLLKGFHGYDFDISFQIKQCYKIVITRDILLSHLSVGNYGYQYYEALRLVTRKWKSALPLYLSSYSKEEILELKLKSLHVFYKSLLHKKNLFLINLTILYFAAKQGVMVSYLKRIHSFLRT